MLIHSTLFVVGAGASAELDFPIGSKLIEDLQQVTKVSLDHFGRAQGHSSFLGAVNHYAATERIAGSVAYDAIIRLNTRLAGTHKSIDQLIHTFRDDPVFVDIAKIGIATVISSYEVQAFKNSVDRTWKLNAWPKGNWLDAFATHYFAGFDVQTLNQLFDDVAFVCFNYDRCIEYGLARLVAHHFDQNEARAIEITKKARIVHPYGSLGELGISPQQIDNQFRKTQSAEMLCEMASNIRTFTEGVEDERIVEQISGEIGRANMVLALGFSFQQPNIDLFKGPQNNGRLFGATTFKLSESDAVLGPHRMQQTIRAGQFSQHAIQSVTASKFLHSLQLALFK